MGWWRKQTGKYLGLALLTCLCLAPSAQAARWALVIGNDKYQQVDVLRNAGADANTMAQAFTEAHYQVRLVRDVGLKAMKDELRLFRQKVRPGDEVVLYYSGHGVDLDGANYLLPVDVRGESADQVRDDALNLSQVLADLRSAGPEFTLAIIDACRDNPFPRFNKGVASRGLSRVQSATGQMVVYAAGEGQKALDRLSASDPTPNGLFTRVFVKEMRRPGISVDQVLKNVRVEVNRLAQSVQHEQVPALYDQVLGTYYFFPANGGGDVVGLQPLQVVQDCPECPKLVVIPGGSFMMGSNENDNEKPAHQVSVNSYLMGQTHVTVGQWRAFADASHYQTDAERNVGGHIGCFATVGRQRGWQAGFNWRNPGWTVTDDQPVVCVSWNDAIAYATWLSQTTHKNYRLPSEAEREYAARATSTGKWSFGENAGDLGQYAWYEANSNSSFHPVARKKPNAWGLYDMHGLALEWVQDVHFANYVGAPTDGSARIGGDPSQRVLRGGSFDFFAFLTRSSFRTANATDFRSAGVSLRIARIF